MRFEIRRCWHHPVVDRVRWNNNAVYSPFSSCFSGPAVCFFSPNLVCVTGVYWMRRSWRFSLPLPLFSWCSACPRYWLSLSNCIHLLHCLHLRDCAIRMLCTTLRLFALYTICACILGGLRCVVLHERCIPEQTRGNTTSNCCMERRGEEKRGDLLCF
jgi:hypothetical protein